MLLKQTSKKVVPIFVSISASNSKQINPFSEISNDFDGVRQQTDARCECAWSDEGGSLVSTTWCGSTVSLSSERTSTLNLGVDKPSALWDCSLNWKPPAHPPPDSARRVDIYLFYFDVSTQTHVCLDTDVQQVSTHWIMFLVSAVLSVAINIFMTFSHFEIHLTVKARVHKYTHFDLWFTFRDLFIRFQTSGWNGRLVSVKQPVEVQFIHHQFMCMPVHVCARVRAYASVRVFAITSESVHVRQMLSMC